MKAATTHPSLDHSPAPRELPLRRLHLLRLGYLILGGGLVAYKWPLLFNHDQPWPVMTSVVTCMLVAMSLLALLGLRYPVQMLPILLFEAAWKLIWLAAVALPLWLDDKMDPDTWASTTEILWVAVILAIIPWRYVSSNYLVRRGDRWREDAQRTRTRPPSNART
ncbi:hypothetical protein [Actinoplanes sp. NBRC 103695]|uniref:hypothetical protein n=1 Tax=Actinoplanes sp. NBRC 103695 TaxID=3032202 RepID=UPI0024A192B6|nr:hypothetical protein [Actinoplanes sp. NBRC 103695]GLZ01225.1 hypothetical protein Acsp02_84760 [Actinoplanes sp. NBRC 103695]